MKKNYTRLFVLTILFLTFVQGKILAQSLCDAPTAVTVSTTTNTAILAWTLPTTNALYNLQYQVAGSSALTTLNNVTSPVTIAGLTCGSTYIAQVQQICPNTPNGLSAWTSVTFTVAPCSPPPCNAPTGLSASNISQTSASLFLSPTSTNVGTFNIQYHISTSTTWTTVNNVTLPYTLTNLACSPALEWKAQQVCAAAAGTTASVSPWSASYTFSRPACTVPCDAPTVLSTTNVSQTGAVLNWNAISTVANSWNIQYRTSTSTAWTTVNNVSKPYQIGNLSCGTTYVWQVQQICANSPAPNNVSAWAGPYNFATLACSPPPCNAPTGLSATSISQTGATLFLTPTSTNVGTFNIQYHVGGANTWTTVNNVTLPYTLANLTCGVAYEWQAQQVCAAAAGTTATVSPWSAGYTFTTSPCTVACTAPTGTTTTNMTQTGAVLSWTLNTTVANSYNIQYHAANVTTWTTINNVTTPYQLGNLACGTAYVWQVQQICATNTAPNTVSPWSAATTFTTTACSPPPCNAPTGLSATSISQTGATLFLTPTSTNVGTFNIQYHVGGANTWSTVNGVTLPYTLSNLTCGTTYEWMAQQICATTAGTTSVSAWSAGSTFSTSVCSGTCTAPTGLTTTNVSQTGAVLNWAPSSTSGTTWNIHYQTSTSTTWTTINNVSLPYQLGNLTCGTAYVWQVQQNCLNLPAPNNVSPYSSPVTFVTTACSPPVCNTPTGLSANNISQTGASLFLTPTSTNVGTFNLQYHVGGANTWTTVSNVTLPYTLANLTCGTTYEWMAQQLCNPAGGVTSVSAWSAGSTFSTSVCSGTCTAPTGLTTTNVSQTGAVLNWAPSSTSGVTWNIHYQTSTSTTWTTINNVSLPYQLGNLTCGTAYVWQVQQNCSNLPAPNNVSPYSSPVTFVTTSCTVPTCNAPTGLSATSISQTGATLFLTPTSSNVGLYNIKYHISGTNTWTSLNSVSLPQTLTNLSCSATYEWQAQQICSTTPGTPIVVSAWSAGSTFSTSLCTTPLCPAPIGLTTTNVSMTAATLNWSAVSGALAYIVRYRPANSTANYTTITTTTPSVNLTGLNAGTYYSWQVQSLCSTVAPNNNPWSVVAAFTTPTLIVYPNPANQSATVYFWATQASTDTLELRDDQGQLLYTITFAVVAGENSIHIPTSEFRDGLYFISIIGSTGVNGSKIIVKH